MIGRNRGCFHKQMLWMMAIISLYAVAFFIFHSPTYVMVHLACWLAVPLLAMYNGQRGRLKWLGNRNANISATIYTRQLSQQQQLDVQRHNQQYPPIIINVCQRNHDRFLIIDDVVYVFGASLKDAGKKLFAYIRMQETSAQELLNKIR